MLFFQLFLAGGGGGDSTFHGHKGFVCLLIARSPFQKQSDGASRERDELKAKLAQAEDDHGKTKQSLTSREEQLNKHQEEISNLKGLNSNKDEEIELLRKAVSEHENEIVVMKNNVELQSAPPEVDDTKLVE